MTRATTRGKAVRENSPWLPHYRHLLFSGMRVLDLGCGTGDDAIELAEWGCEVVALDLDPARVRRVPASIARLRLVGDIIEGLPFLDETFDGISASLSLHYFRSLETERAFADISRVLRSNGLFLCRVNAVGDVNFGYGQGEEIEPSVYLQTEGHLKRFFDEPMLRHFVEPCFRLDRITAREILQRDCSKQTIECVARKR